ncbi:MAG TPA: Wzz/FepE/Etk N-terminal domain-containing protein [Azospirillaceae bacterium]|nr:Wzz/FepE/Etk N-terminal domain-containing protein [Azospirillaceae bacterium]
MEQRSLSPGYLLAAVRQRKLVVLAIAILSLLAAIASDRLARPIYQAATSLLVVYHEEYTDFSADGRPTSNIRVGLDEAMGAELQILNSRSLKRDLVTALGPDRLYPPEEDGEAMLLGYPVPESVLAWVDGTRTLKARVQDWLTARLPDPKIGKPSEPPAPLSPMERAGEMLSRDLQIRRIEGTNTIALNFRHEDPGMAANTLNTLVDLFTERRRQFFQDSNNRETLREELATADARMRTAEEKLNAYMGQSRTVGLEAQVSLLLERRAKLAADLSDTRQLMTPAQRADIGARIAGIDREMETLNHNSQGLLRLQRERDTALKAFERLNGLAATMQLSDMLQRSRQPTIRVIDPALPPVRPQGLSSANRLGFGLLFGLLGGVMAAAALGPRRPLQPSVRQIESQLGAPVLAVLEFRPDRVS